MSVEVIKKNPYLETGALLNYYPASGGFLSNLEVFECGTFLKTKNKLIIIISIIYDYNIRVFKLLSKGVVPPLKMGVERGGIYREVLIYLITSFLRKYPKVLQEKAQIRRTKLGCMYGQGKS